MISLPAVAVTNGQNQVSGASASGAPDMSLLTGAKLALSDGFLVVAEKKFKKFLQQSGLSASDIKTANEGLLQALLLQKKYDELQGLVEQLAGRKKITSEEAAYWQARVLYDETHYTKAVELLAGASTNAVAKKLTEPGMRLLALSRLKGGDVEGAIQTFKVFATRYPKSKLLQQNRLDWGRALVFQGKMGDAIKVLEPVLLASDQRLANEARYWIGRSLLQQKDRKKGLAMLRPLLDQAGVSEGIRVNTVLAVVEAGSSQNIDSGIKLLAQTLASVKSEDDRRRMSSELCKLLLDSGRLDEASSLIRDYIAKNPDEVSSAELQLKLGDALLAAKRFDDAIAVYQQYLEVFANAGGYAQARYGRGWALLGAKRYAEAAQEFEKAYELFKDPGRKMECLFKVGDARLQNEQYKKAIAAYEKYLEQYPKSTQTPRVLFNIGVCQQLLGDAEAAGKSFELVVKRNPDAPEAMDAILRIAAMLRNKKDWKGAEQQFDRAMKLYPKSSLFVKALYGRGEARYHQWSPKALEDFERVVREFPDSKETERAFFMRAMCLYRLGRDEPALAVCDEFIKRYTDSELAPRVRFWIGRFAYNTGEYERARKEFSAFVKEYPKHELVDAAQYRDGMAAVKQKEYVQAIEIFGKLAKDYPQSKYLAGARFYQADAMCELGKFSGAIIVFDELINKYPESTFVPLAWGRKGDCLFTLGADDIERYREAMRSYRVVTQDPQARQDHVLQAQYKIGRCLEKLGEKDAALEHYYSKVMVPFLLKREQGKAISASEKVWFTRAALSMTDEIRKKEDWRKLVRILNRIVEADVAVSADARKQIKEIETDKWWLFY